MSTIDRRHDEPRLSLDERRARLERKAEVIRSRLLRHVDALDARRHQVTEVGRRAKDAVPRAVTVVLAGGALLGAGIGLVTWAVRARRRRLLSVRLAAAVEPFRARRRPSLAAELGRKLLVTVVGVLASELARRSAKMVLEGRLLAGASATPSAPEPAFPVVHAGIYGGPVR